MRNLQSKDIFALARVINTIGVKEEIKRIALKANTAKEMMTEEVGFEFMFSLFEKATEKKAEKALFEFFADVFECTYDEASQMDPVEFLDKVVEVAEPAKWKAFFQRVASLIQ